jgi:hypothetical protein
MHPRIILAALITLICTLSIAAQEPPPATPSTAETPPGAYMEETPPKCAAKPNGDIQCDVWSKNGIVVDLHPHRPAVTFTIQAWESHIGWPAVTYTITQESQRGTYYRFLEGRAWILRLFNFYFEAWITRCSAGGTTVRCSDVFDFRPVP